MILGPSTPLSPLLFQHGIHFLSGARVEYEETAVLTNHQAASLPQVKGVRLLTMQKLELELNLIVLSIVTISH